MLLFLARQTDVSIDFTRPSFLVVLTPTKQPYRTRQAHRRRLHLRLLTMPNHLEGFSLVSPEWLARRLQRLWRMDRLKACWKKLSSMVQRSVSLMITYSNSLLRQCVQDMVYSISFLVSFRPKRGKTITYPLIHSLNQISVIIGVWLVSSD